MKQSTSDRKTKRTAPPLILSAKNLSEGTTTETAWIIPDILPMGTALLAGKPKVGKSWFALQVALAVSRGDSLFDRQLEPREVLYLALEDTFNRLQSRLQMFTGEKPAGLHLATTWSTWEEGIPYLKKILKQHPAIKLIIIDTLQRFRANKKSAGNFYTSDYEDISTLKKIADTHGVTFLMIHHLRKGTSEDPFDAVSGSMGLTGSVDTTIILDRIHGRQDARMYVTGRDVEEQEFILKRESTEWILLGEVPPETPAPQELKTRKTRKGRCAHV